jgi:hypothetical protein
MRATTSLLLVGLAACGAEQGSSTTGAQRVELEPGPRMRAGDNCLRCHSALSGTGAPVWTAAGTVYPSADARRTTGVEGATVVLTDPAGKVVRLITNEVGNFWTDEPLATDFRVRLEYEGRVADMPIPPPAGSCNACHSVPPVGEALGRIRVP